MTQRTGSRDLSFDLISAERSKVSVATTLRATNFVRPEWRTPADSLTAPANSLATDLM